MLPDPVGEGEPTALSHEDLPGSLQATFVPDRASIAWWGVADLASTPALQNLLPGSEPGSVDLALPVREGNNLDVRARRVRCLLTDLPTARAHLRETPTLEPANAPSASVAFWRRWASSSWDAQVEESASLAAAMPVSAHCAVFSSGDHIATATATLLQADSLVRTSRAIAESGVAARLRPYQAQGVAWLERQASNAGGGILADEMGLGKTVQAICLMAGRAERPHLIICPTSVLGNWRREFSRFAPTASVRLYHGVSRHLNDIESAVVITSYSVARTDRVQLSCIPWDLMILDEAQQIKNPDAQNSRAVRTIPSAAKIAMTGTPVENRLDELWAILNVTNPVVLGDRTRFKQRFATPIERRGSQRAATRLNALVTPHILRRTKKEVAPELPPKILIDVVCTLTDEQRSLYQREIERSFNRGLGSGIERHGRVLALLTSLKQICNHPAQFLKDDGPFEGRSGKGDRLVEMLTDMDETDRSLVFTQYRETGDLLATHLSPMYGRTVPFLHGGLTASRRDELIQAFQEDEHAAPVLVVSLRAAGFGINLTRANNVVHFDRWWNPAVEDQATDRAHRIGQTRTLSVYSLVTESTLEDHIVVMHKSKRDLAGIITGDSEAALARLGDDELFDIISLDAVQAR